MTGHSVRIVADAIARHLAIRPGCADSVEGIQQWWLRPAGVEVPLEIVSDALRLLEEERVVECRLLGAREIWRLWRGEG
ncbi:hypothetical protein SAMN05216570_2894 [Dyella sp. OK004]|uniref:hypothetical protein n=1 Tax=Dyella sp. OK004 TaxID=1855292 RepID=UPI0008EF8A7F|nr:hypothetical protein [Dyella sp. OK004]SFS13566.1 hypothetical protein SAMN05216570_2894 [Dyella sp. OK004]